MWGWFWGAPGLANASCSITQVLCPQVICDKIFRRWFPWVLRGAAVSARLQKQVHQAVLECAAPQGTQAAGPTQLQKLQRLLQATLQELREVPQ